MTKFNPVTKKGSEKTLKTSPAPGSGYGCFDVINIKPVAEASIRCFLYCLSRVVARAARFSEGGWDAFKTPTASNSVICFRVELHLEPKPTRHGRTDNHAAKGLSSPCRGCCSRWNRWRNGNGKSDGNRRS